MATQSTEQPQDWPSLLDASRAGDDEAFGEICDRLSSYLLLMTSNQLEGGLSAKLGASDIVQQALLEARQDIASFRGTSEKEFRVWLVRLVQHNLVDSARKYRQAQKRDVSRELQLGTEGMETTIPAFQKSASSIVRRRETDDQLLRAVAQLPSRQQRVIELRHWQGLGFAEVSQELNISEVAARNLWSRAINKLRQKLAVNHASQPRQPR